jgi:DNA primase
VAKIPQRFIDDLLDRVDIVEVIDRRVKLRKTGKNFSACCPFHDEKTPSFSVNPDKQFFYCFGCGAGGNALGFLMDYERLEFPQAVESLAQTAGLEVPKEEGRPGEASRQDTQRPLFDQLEQATRFYEHSLRKHPDAKRAVKYLKSRGLSGEIAKAFRVGFAPPGWDNLIVAVGNSEEKQQLLMTTGMLVKNDKGRVYDRFRDRIIFPIVDARGRVIAFGGRVLGDDKPKYLNSPETPVFHKSRELYGLYQARKANRSLERIVVVEGYMDVIALAQHGINYAVATLGTATSEAHLDRLFRHVPEVIFCFDGDEAGRKAAFRGLEAALPVMQDGRQVRFLFLPEGEDPDSLVRAKGQGHLEHLFTQASPLDVFLFDQLEQGIDVTTLDGRARFSKVAAPYLQQLPEGVFKTLMYQALAERTGIDVDSLKRLQAPSERDSAAPEYTRRSNQDAVLSMNELASSATDRYSDLSRSEAFSDDYADIDGMEPGVSDSSADAPFIDAIDDSLTPTANNDIHKILGLLVLNPALAKNVAIDGLPAVDRRDLLLLKEFLKQIQSDPDTTTAALLGFWYGTPEGQLLTELAGKEALDDDEGREALFAALMERLMKMQQNEELRTRIDYLKSRDYAELSGDEKRELITLTQKIRTLAGRS